MNVYEVYEIPGRVQTTRGRRRELGFTCRAVKNVLKRNNTKLKEKKKVKNDGPSFSAHACLLFVRAENYASRVCTHKRI